MAHDQLINCQRNPRERAGRLMNRSPASSRSTNTTNLNADQQEPRLAHIRTPRSLVHAFKKMFKEAVLKAKRVCRKKSRSNASLAPCDEEIDATGDGKQDQSQGNSSEDTNAFSKYPIPSTRPIIELPSVAANSILNPHSTASFGPVTHVEDNMVLTPPDQADSSPSRVVSPLEPESRTITVEQASSASDAQPVNLDIQTQIVQSIAADGASVSSRGGTQGEIPSSWKTQFKMVIHLPKEGSKTRIAKLDTGSAVNVVSKSVADALGMKMEKYYGGDVVPLGGKMTPLGQLTLDWHVMERAKTYTTTFLVLDTEDFDVLLSDETIGRIGFYTVNREIWYLRKADDRI